MRIDQGSVKEAAKGGWIHVLQEIPFNPGESPAFVFNRPPAGQSERKIIDIEKYDQAYRALLSQLTLSPEHAANLEGRGLSDTTITTNLYATLPNQTQARMLTAFLINQRIDVEGVPGFYKCRDYNVWTFAAYLRGFLVPFRDIEGRIQGCQIRLDQLTNRNTRYIWLSSNPDTRDKNNNLRYPDGTSSGKHVHFARPWRARSSGEVIITEGALKADVIADLLDETVIGLPGFDNFDKDHFAGWLKDQLPELTYIAIAFDQDDDADKRARTESTAANLIDRLNQAGIEAQKVQWPEGHKGFDDYLRLQAEAGR